MRGSELPLIALVAIFALCSAAVAQTDTSTAQPPPDDPDQIICKMSPPVTGTRIGGGRECHTKREWDQRQKDSQEEVEHGQEIGHLGSSPGH